MLPDDVSPLCIDLTCSSGSLQGEQHLQICGISRRLLRSLLTLLQYDRVSWMLIGRLFMMAWQEVGLSEPLAAHVNPAAYLAK